MAKKKDAGRFEDSGDDAFDDDPNLNWDDDAIGRLPGDAANDFDPDDLPDPDEGLPPAKAASRRAMLGVPEDFDDDENPSPARALQDAIIDEVNDILEDEWNWQQAAERAYEALVIDPTYPRAANAILRCYLTKRTLRDMQHALHKLFNPYEEAPNQTHRMLAYSYRVLSRADLWLEWIEELPPELSDVAPLMKQGLDELNTAYCDGDKQAYTKARAAFAAALKGCSDRSTLMWFLAREYADKGFFADSAALLGAMVAAGSTSKDVHRLHAEMMWWRDQGRWLPWIH
jgi:tetratricopeptide (TPR) repeat protein